MTVSSSGQSSWPIPPTLHCIASAKDLPKPSSFPLFDEYDFKDNKAPATQLLRSANRDKPVGENCRLQLTQLIA
ncbi:hypothetical protein AMTR_s00002p00262970 [Amborella trichopoda]|uniref:Uncharacterized protein n=1 Tax=Amborella trichopoda TaxID=13333 RepID=W1P0D0_AMBTC|nr:hypothetical protein AMTR_s00002p00262970 [Amborella trichopoda]